jgi:hypothetical protein
MTEAGEMVVWTLVVLAGVIALAVAVAWALHRPRHIYVRLASGRLLRLRERRHEPLVPEMLDRVVFDEPLFSYKPGDEK